LAFSLIAMSSSNWWSDAHKAKVEAKLAELRSNHALSTSSSAKDLLAPSAPTPVAPIVAAKLGVVNSARVEEPAVSQESPKKSIAVGVPAHQTTVQPGKPYQIDMLELLANPVVKDYAQQFPKDDWAKVVKYTIVLGIRAASLHSPLNLETLRSLVLDDTDTLELRARNIPAETRSKSPAQPKADPIAQKFMPSPARKVLLGDETEALRAATPDRVVRASPSVGVQQPTQLAHKSETDVAEPATDNADSQSTAEKDSSRTPRRLSGVASEKRAAGPATLVLSSRASKAEREHMGMLNAKSMSHMPLDKPRGHSVNDLHAASLSSARMPSDKGAYSRKASQSSEADFRRGGAQSAAASRRTSDLSVVSNSPGKGPSSGRPGWNSAVDYYLEDYKISIL
jgi:hypothetical protein